jgi:hypothetical protein
MVDMTRGSTRVLSDSCMSRIKTFAVVGGAVGSWVAAYWYFADSLDKSSSLVTQTMFNINNNTDEFEQIRSPVKLNSSIRGKMNQFKGFADINFHISDSENSNTQIYNTQGGLIVFREIFSRCKGTSARSKLEDRQFESHFSNWTRNQIYLINSH